MATRRLTEQQKKRIQAIQDRRRERLQQKGSQALGKVESQQDLEGIVVIRHGATLGVRDPQGQIFRCQIRQNIGQAVCGDHVIWQKTDGTNGIVIALQPRKSILSRPDYSGKEKPLAANITQLVIVLAPQPTPSGYLLDQYLVTAENMGIKPLIAINKTDLLDGRSYSLFLDSYQHYNTIGYPVIAISAKRERGLDQLISHLQHQTSILVGQSGVGKSSLVNALLPALEIETSRLSQATGLGKHTTSTATCYDLPQGGQLIDSPGVRSFRLTALSKQQLEAGFPEFRAYLGKCRFNDCSHDHEPECAIQQAVEQKAVHPQRLNNFIHLSRTMTQQ